LTTFLVFHLRVAENGQSADLTFVLSVPLCGLPIGREASILSDILQDKKRLLVFISLLLQDATAEGFMFDDDLGMGKNARPSRPLEDTEIPLLETMVRALHRNPGRIDAVQDVLELLQKDPKACSLIPDEFLHIWQPILAARKALHSEEHPNGKN
jgi:hypothetical protein